jgi:hypothetical protein
MRPNLLALLVGLLLVIVAGNPGIKQSEPSRRLQPPPAGLKYLTLGFNEFASDLLWLRLIQDFDYCDRGEGRTQAASGATCERGWVYQMLAAITELTPKFATAYRAGGIMLSVLVDDRQGASEIFERGLKEFPSDWSLQYRAAYHYLYNTDDRARAADLLVGAARNGGPAWLYALAAKLYTEQGKARFGKAVLEEVLEKNADERFTPRIKERLDEINRALEKSGNED